MRWDLLILQGPVFHDRLYDALGALIVFLVGSAILFKTGNKFGWLFVAAAAVWAFLTFRDLLAM